MQVIPIASNSIESLLPTIDKILWELISHEYDKKCRAEGVAVVDDVFFKDPKESQESQNKFLWSQKSQRNPKKSKKSQQQSKNFQQF